MNRSIRVCALFLCLALSLNVSAQGKNDGPSHTDGVAYNYNYKRGTHFGFEGSFLYYSGLTESPEGLGDLPVWGEFAANVGYSWGDGLYAGFDLGCLYSSEALFLDPALVLKYNFRNDKRSPFVKVKVGSNVFPDLDNPILYQFCSTSVGVDFRHFSVYVGYYNINITSSVLTWINLCNIGIGYNF
ncbi:MAG: hypothetical protein LKK19_06370 [Bacteroidales bacterium]|nr:hypothetical protein [Bacteroidales bacterium]MCI2122310.1 hypothetical protein [Bacteroidales bacterium]